MAVGPEEQTPSAPGEISSGQAVQASASSVSVAQGLTSDWKWVNQQELQTLVTRAADGSNVEIAAKASSLPVEGESAGTFVRVVTESGPEIQGNSTSGGGSRQIAHILLSRTSLPSLSDSSSKGKSEAGKKKTVANDEDFDNVDLEKGLNPAAAGAGVDSGGAKGSAREYEAGEEAVCRVCHFSLGPSKDAVMDLGCSCKRDLSHAHRECAETWFRVRGNRKCEICGEIALNVHLAEAPASTSTGDTTTITVVTVHHRYACQNKAVRVVMVFIIAAFLVPWLFRFAYRQ